MLPIVVGLLLVLLALAVWSRHVPDHDDRPPAALWMTDAARLPPGSLRVGEQVTGPISKEQKRPPCLVRERLEMEIKGACWWPHMAKPPCPAGLREHSGVCVAPVLAAKREPTSVGQ